MVPLLHKALLWRHEFLYIFDKLWDNSRSPFAAVPENRCGIVAILTVQQLRGYQVYREKRRKSVVALACISGFH